MVTSSSEESVFENNGAGHGSDSSFGIEFLVSIYLRLALAVLVGLRLFAVIDFRF